ncbi:MAG: asparaginase [Phycisphaerales bacterium]|nr:asparaginase [Phycisphaerales bacterium]
MFRVLLISTGGTIEKTYDARAGVLTNRLGLDKMGLDRLGVLDAMLESLELGGVVITRLELMNKDSLEMTEEDHQTIANAAIRGGCNHDGIVIVHGTDRLAHTGEVIWQAWSHAGAPRIPVVLTGAMRPYEMRQTDALQNLTESLLAVQILAVGVYAVLHNKVLAFPHVVKDPQHGTFVQTEQRAAATRQ